VAQRRLRKFMEKDRFACVKCEPNQPQGFRVNTTRTLVAKYSGTSRMTLSTRRPQGCSFLGESHLLVSGSCLFWLAFPNQVGCVMPRSTSESWAIRCARRVCVARPNSDIISCTFEYSLSQLSKLLLP
jgi:hypothetical protein